MNAVNDASRLESLWGGAFGVEYTKRNAAIGEHGARFWRARLAECPAESALEIGCNLGGNLRWLSSFMAGGGPLVGIDVNAYGLTQVRAHAPAARPVMAAARQLPFRAGAFDLVFTMGVLIHQPPATLPAVLDEIVRCAQRFVICAEYFAERLTAVPYRGQEGALFKCDFGALYRARFPALRQLSTGFLPRAEGWDDVTYWVFAK